MTPGVRTGASVFVDTGAWIALALTRDVLHPRAVQAWQTLTDAGARLHTSVPVVLETFTFLDRQTTRDVALRWQESLGTVARLKILPCTVAEMGEAWDHFRQRDLHKLSAVDATSFVLMARRSIRLAFAFDHHFASAGFQLVG